LLAAQDDGTAEDRAGSRARAAARSTTAESACWRRCRRRGSRPAQDKVLTPLYEAKVDPDIYFFGFDLTVGKRAAAPVRTRPTTPVGSSCSRSAPEPRFGLDTDQQPGLNTWSDLSWQDVQPGAPALHRDRLRAGELPTHAPTGEDPDKSTQFGEDQHVVWSHGMNSAELAYILFQVPVLVAVHASEMLLKK